MRFMRFLCAVYAVFAVLKLCAFGRFRFCGLQCSTQLIIFSSLCDIASNILCYG